MSVKIRSQQISVARAERKDTNLSSFRTNETNKMMLICELTGGSSAALEH